MIYPEDIPYLKTSPKIMSLPIGSHVGKGNLVFLYSDSLVKSIQLMNQKKQMSSNRHYMYYYIPTKYNFKVYNTICRENDLKGRKTIYDKVEKETDIMPYMKSLTISPNEAYNTYFDLHKYLNFIYTNTTKLTLGKIVRAIWNVLNPVLTETYGTLSKKYVLCDLNAFPTFGKGTAAEKVKNPLYLMYLTLWKFYDVIEESNLDVDFLFYTDTKVLKFNPKKSDKKTFRLFLVEATKIYNSIKEKEILTKDEEEDIDTTVVTACDEDEEPVKSPPEDELPSDERIMNFASNIAGGFSSKPKLKNDIAVAIDKTVKEKKQQLTSELKEDKVKTDEIESEIDTKAKEEAEKDEDLVKEIYNKMQENNDVKHSDRSTARDNMLREKQQEIAIKGKTVSDLQKIEAKHIEVEKNDVSKHMINTNPNMKEISFQNFNKTYVENVLNKDIMDCFLSLNDKSIKLFIRDVKVEDSSNEMNYKETWTISLEDENRQRHTIKVDIPKWVDNNFLWLGGNKKIIKNQNFFLPIVKIAKDTVLIVSNMNKITISRVDTKSLRGISIIDKLLEKSDPFNEYFVVGNTFFDNHKDHKYITTLEYDDLSKRFKSFKNGKTEIYFNQDEASAIATKKNVKVDKNTFFIGFDKGEPILIDFNTQRDKQERSISDIIFNNLPDDITEIKNKIKVPKRLMYTKMTTMKQDLPMGLILCLWEGLTKVLQKSHAKYRIAENLKDIGTNEDFIKFSNCYLIYDGTVENELLLNGLKAIDSSKYEISEFDTTTPYIPYVEKKFGRVTALNTLNNAYEFMLGNIEKEVLRDMGCPTDIVSLCIYANKLLSDNDHLNELDERLSRVRCAEIIPGILYDKISKAYTPFKNSNGKKKISISQDAVIKDLLALKTVEDFSSLNPFLEMEETHGLSTKGWRGINLEKSYNVPRRSYDKSMTGIIAPTSSPDGNVGVNRSLSLEPKISSVRGYSVISDNLDDVKDINLFSPAEMIIPLGVTNDDPVRTGHSVKQSRHVVPIKEASPVLISNGCDELCKYYLSSDYVVNAKMDGEIVEKDETTKIMIVKYKDGTHQAVNLDKTIVKNGGGGFELSNQLITKLNVGDKVKKNDTIAYHKNFFSASKLNGTRVNIGPMTKIAIMGTYNTYEDCTFVTQKLSKACTTEMCFKTSVVIGKNANVSHMLKVDDEVHAGDPIIQFDNSFDESDINKLLEALGEDENLKDAVISNSKNSIKSKYSGVIEDIKMYSPLDLEELSPSLQKIFGKYYKKINDKKKLLDKYDKNDSIMKCGMLLTEPVGKVEPNRYGVLAGEKVGNDSVVIRFEIKHEEPLECGSKIANFTALKNVVGEVLPEGLEPYSDFRKDEEIGTFIPAISILARMTPSIFLNALGNKCIIELKRSLFEIWKHVNGPMKRKSMEDLIYKFFTAFDKSGDNTKRYKEMFTPMSDNAFITFFKNLFANKDEYLILHIVDYERTIVMDDIERAAKVINIPLYEYVFMPHINGDKEHPIITQEKVPVGYINIKRTQQTIAKKNGLSTNIDKRSPITGQVVQGDKNGRESDLENIMLTSLGMEKTLKELNGPRADDLVMKQEMLSHLATKGYVKLDELTDEIENKTTLNTVDVYFLGMSLKTDLVTKGYKTIGTLKKE